MLIGILLLVIETACGLLTMMFLARFLMQWARVSFRNQLGQFVVATTDWAVRPMRRVLPGLFGLDLASLVPAWLTQILFAAIEITLQGLAGMGNPLGLVLGVVGLGLLAVFKLAIYLLMGVVLISAVLSWVNPYAPAAPVFFGLADPFLRPIRRVIPSVANVDLSPLVLILALQILLMVLASAAGGFVGLIVGR
ncbi:MAG: YggT family protein [Zoogloeaceae bacterium]|nr:YggT family protein [Zoogloeaceae bacterium]